MWTYILDGTMVVLTLYCFVIIIGVGIALYGRAREAKEKRTVQRYLSSRSSLSLSGTDTDSSRPSSDGSAKRFKARKEE